jgi:isopentenyldiphosphate isomerase
MKIPIVDEQDNILYFKDLKERGKTKEISRITALWVINEKREVLIAKRSKNKNWHPDIWGISVAGTVEEGETYEGNIKKEAEEEIGLKINLDEIKRGQKTRHSIGHEYFCQWFFVKVPSDTKFTLQESEVDEAKWISIEDLKNWCLSKPGEFLPNFHDNSLSIVQDFLA